MMSNTKTINLMYIAQQARLAIEWANNETQRAVVAQELKRTLEAIEAAAREALEEG
jgi:hypothetical protein